MWRRRQAAETGAVLAAAWAALPPALRLPTQFLGRQYVGCAATIGVMPRCDFTCRGCYLGAGANRLPPRPMDELKAQLRLIRAWLGPAGNLQLTDGEVTLRPEAELVERIRTARDVGARRRSHRHRTAPAGSTDDRDPRQRAPER